MGKELSPAEQQIFDLGILRVLDANRTRHGLTAENIKILATQFGVHDADLELIKDRLDYFCRKEFCEEALAGITKANRAWRITEKGIAMVDEYS